MPADSAYYRTNWVVNPETGAFEQLIDGNPTDTSASLEEVSGGAYRLDPIRPGDTLGYVRDLSTGRLYSTITLEQPAVMNVNAAGDISLMSPVEQSQINERIFAQGRYGASANVQLELPTGENPQFNVTSWLTRENDRLVVKEGSAPGDRDRYRYTSEFQGKEAYDPTAPGSGWRYATPEETLSRGLIGRVIEDQRQLVDDMVALGVIGPDGEPVRTPYEAAALIATQTSDMSVQRVSSLE